MAICVDYDECSLVEELKTLLFTGFVLNVERERERMNHSI